MHSLLNRVVPVIASAVIISFYGCSDRVPEFELVELDPTLVVSLELTNGETVVHRDESFIDESNYGVLPLEFKTYFSEIELQNTSGDWVNVSEALFFDFKPIDSTLNNPQWGNAAVNYIPAGDYQKIRFGLGLPSYLNAIDPSTYENQDPLSVYTNMYWTWATKYRFVILEAKVDTTGGSDFSWPIIVHTGLDSLYRPGLEFPIDLSLNDFDRDTLHFQVDWNRLFHTGPESINLIDLNVTHTTDTEEEFEMSRKFSDNFAASLTIKE